MIVRGLRAEGFMRYELLELTDLPSGVIALVGENEAGKSTIGEAIAFSLFGRTIRTEDTDPTQAIHWDADVCKTSIRVEIGTGGVYQVDRLVARTGEFEARLTGPDGGEIASGAREVASALQHILGYDFSAFRYSFYVAQGELDLIQRDGRDNATRVVCDMLGISTIERAVTDLEEALRGLSERSGMLERDLIVARALHTEALPVRDEIDTYEAQLAEAQAAQRSAQAEELRAGEAFTRWDKASQAQRDWTRALTRLEGSLTADALRTTLLGTRTRLAGLVAQAEEQAKKASSAMLMDAKPREKAKEALEQAELINLEATRLETIVAHRREQLEMDTASGGSVDSLPMRQLREEQTLVREGLTVKLSTAALVLMLLLALAGGGLAAGWQLPKDEPLVSAPPKRLHSPRLGIVFDPFTPKRASMIAGAAAGLFLVLGVWAFIRRKGAKHRIADALEERARLEGLLAKERDELAACLDFKVGPLKDVTQELSWVDDPQVRQALAALSSAAGGHMDGPLDPKAVLDQARQRMEELRGSKEKVEPRLAEAKRIVDVASRALADVEQALAEAYPDGLPETEEPTGEAPTTAQALVEAIEDASRAAAQARIAYEAVAGAGQVAPVAEPARELRAAIMLGLEVLPGGQDRVRASYEERTGLPELLKDRDTSPTVEGIRAVIKREHELLDEVFGSEEAHRKQLREVEDQLRVARVQKASAEAELAEAVARGARVATGRRRLAELEEKIAGLEEVLRPTERQVEVHLEAIQLLGELAHALKARFGPGIARYIEVVLPRLTQGRYRRTRISEDLDIRVYSTERGDFVRLIELSLGTADQILVSLRLGLARALMASRGIRGGHFLFLDEALVSADEAREAAFFDLLRTFDDEFAQIFVTSPRSLAQNGLFATQLSLTRDVRVVQQEAQTSA